MANIKRLYLDVSTFCRPYDEQTSLRVRLETDAYYLILAKLECAVFQPIISSVHFAEIADFSDTRERLELEALLKRLQMPANHLVEVVRRRTDELIDKKFGIADAAHAAFAETLADVFISCDDRLVKKCRKHLIRIKSCNPVEFVEMENLK